MRLLIPVMLLMVPLSGCLGGIGTVDTSELFDYIEVQRGDPEPIPFATCQDLLTALNVRAEQRALVSLHQDYEHRNSFGFWGGEDWEGGVEAVEESADAGAPQASRGESAGGASDAGYAARDAEVTGTNNQELGVDEADVLKTDGEWTYAIDGRYLQIMHSSTVGNLTSYATIKLTDTHGWGTQLLLVDRGNDDPSDDRLVVILNGVQDPEQEESKPSTSGDAREAAVSSDIAYWGGNSFSQVMVLDIGNRSNPTLVAEHFIEGFNAGARLVDGVAYVVVHYSEPYLNLRTWAGPDDETLEEEGMTWEEYWNAPPARQQEVLRASVQNAIEHNKEQLAKATLDDYLPRLYHEDEKAAYSDEACNQILSTLDDMGRSVSTILSVDADASDAPYATTQILGGYPLVYGALDALVLASSSQEHWWFWAQPELDEATNLHWFDLDGLEVTHRASGRVDGIVQDQFGIDVHNDQLRVVTTTGNWGRWWVDNPEPMQNHLFVFDEVEGLLVPAGSVTGFAEDERIWSARFTNERAYLVTFEQVDPLWIIDLTDANNPEIIGELKIPGVSTYIHPLPGEDALLTIGMGPPGDCEDINDVDCEEAQGLDWNRIQVNLFDISDPANPLRADVYDVTLPESKEYSDGESYESYSWGYSGAVHEHKAFNYWDSLGMLAIPVAWHHYQHECSTDGSRRTCVTSQEFHSGLDLIDVNRDNMTLEHYGAVDQDRLIEDSQNDYYWGADVQRSYFLGFPNEFPDKPVSVYAYSSIGLSAHDLETLRDQDAVGFHGPRNYYEVYEEKAEEESTIIDDLTVA